MLAVSAFVLVVPLAAQAFLGLAWLVFGQGRAFGQYSASASAYDLPEGVAATHLALSTLLLIAWLLHRYVHGRDAEWLVSVQPGWRMRYLVVCLGLAAVVLNAALWASFVLGAPDFGPPQPGWLTFLLVLLITSPLQAVAEEVFFRGYLLQAIGSASGRAWVGIVATALLFAFFHGSQSPALFAHRFVFGLLAGWLVLRTGGLEAGIAAHIINNLFAFGYALFTGGLAATKAVSEITWAKAAFDIAGFALFALVAVWMGRKFNLATTTPQLAQK
ncbi:CPBP family intramembrane metalloprotease [Tessaracoccus antarcticus]|uniref:CPBP family intramembrane metalloprotease n=1 Tax=Tessaracoccus antarcticus TaxID=2479848 RepID=A0A3M0G4C7_9ACTN|nr:CPBP family intramembrane metalloprotease [Tessaracoccus antarcticus]